VRRAASDRHAVTPVGRTKKAMTKKRKTKTEVLEPESVGGAELLPDDETIDLPAEETDREEESTKVTAVVPAGLLSAYLSEVNRYPLLTRDEEHELAVQLKKTGDPDAAAKLVTSNLRLVVKIAMEFQRAFINLMDLIQEGNIGLMQAVAKFDPFKGVKLSSYAAWWIKAYILRYILNNWRMVKIGTTQAQRKLFFNLQKEKERLEAQGIVPTHKLLSEHLDVNEKDVLEMDIRMSRPEMSLQTPLSDSSSGTTVGDMTPSHEILQDEAIANAQMNNIYHSALEDFEKTLSGKELYIYKKRMLGDPPATLQEIGDEFKITRERVRQIENRLLKKLQGYFQEHGIKPPR
jgi:RNA polymerase sigma-32 factor